MIKKQIMELGSYMIMMILANAFFLYREIRVIVNNKIPEGGALEVSALKQKLTYNY